MSRYCVTDWTNPASPTFNKARKADLWSLYWTATEASTQGIVGRKIIAWQPGVLHAPDGSVAGAPYNLELDELAGRLGARTNVVLHVDDQTGIKLMLIDITKRGVIAEMATLRMKHFGFADGHHLDYWWMDERLVPDIAAWYRALNFFAYRLRTLQPNALLICQSDRIGSDIWGAASGQYIEQKPTFNNRTLKDHEIDLKMFRDSMAWYAPRRELISVCELRDLVVLTAAEIKAFSAWASSQDLYLSIGRNETAKGAP